MFFPNEINAFSQNMKFRLVKYLLVSFEMSSFFSYDHQIESSFMKHIWKCVYFACYAAVWTDWILIDFLWSPCSSSWCVSNLSVACQESFKNTFHLKNQKLLHHSPSILPISKIGWKGSSNLALKQCYLIEINQHKNLWFYVKKCRISYFRCTRSPYLG